MRRETSQLESGGEAGFITLVFLFWKFEFLSGHHSQLRPDPLQGPYCPENMVSLWGLTPGFRRIKGNPLWKGLDV